MSNSHLRFETRRKLAHILLTFWPILFVFLGFSRFEELVIYTAYLAFMLLSEFLRIRYDYNTPTAMLLRSVSRSTINGDLKKKWKKVRIPYWIIGSLFAMALFGPQIIIASTVCLTFGDSVSGMTKALLQRRRSPVGIGMGILVSMILTYILTGAALMAILSSIIGMIGDASNLVNDNLSIPVLAALGAYLGSII